MSFYRRKLFLSRETQYKGLYHLMMVYDSTKNMNLLEGQQGGIGFAVSRGTLIGIYALGEQAGSTYTYAKSGYNSISHSLTINVTFKKRGTNEVLTDTITTQSYIPFSYKLMSGGDTFSNATFTSSDIVYIRNQGEISNAAQVVRAATVGAYDTALEIGTTRFARVNIQDGDIIDVDIEMLLSGDENYNQAVGVNIYNTGWVNKASSKDGGAITYGYSECFTAPKTFYLR